MAHFPSAVYRDVDWRRLYPNCNDCSDSLDVERRVYAAHSFMHIFDLALIIPGALGVVITGIILSVRTHWGLTKYYWIIFKEVIGLILIASGGVLNIWVQDAINITLTERLDALNNPAYLHDRLMLLLFGAGQLILLVTVVLVSVKKPWGKRNSKRLAEAANQ